MVSWTKLFVARPTQSRSQLLKMSLCILLSDEMGNDDLIDDLLRRSEDDLRIAQHIHIQIRIRAALFSTI